MSSCLFVSVHDGDAIWDAINNGIEWQVALLPLYNIALFTSKDDFQIQILLVKRLVFG
ncbi:hypothetical protein J2X69_000825 [Algoriphagus sp. 4150]|uniref:hypothetical protein n=1 Tax=Algoriphagus sp. 4150 TaxID=2817756 RepID=UPI002860252B|nr:hypothetical protein [Algoriphagus sp. 4150]MDR7128493.1 hypothetical protein [Algoriphagus sp. 4150]